MERIRSLLKPIAFGLVGLMLLATSLLTIGMAYILFAPADWPKPDIALPGQEMVDETPMGEEGDHETDSHATPTPIAGDNGDGHTPMLPVEIEQGSGILIDTGSKVINLADQSGRRYIKVNVVLEFAPDDPDYWFLHEGQIPVHERPAYVSGGDDGGEAEVSADVLLEEYITQYTAKVNVLKPAIDDKLISIFSSKTFEEIKTAEGKEHLREEILEEMNHLLEGYHIIGVYFTEFVIQ